MASNPRRVYWDSCTWIALIGREPTATSTGTSFEIARNVIEAAQRGKIEILSSSIALVEVCRIDRAAPSAPADLDAFFEHEFVLQIAADQHVCLEARKLMQHSFRNAQGDKLRLKPPDAIHLASAVIGLVAALHTFDRGLLRLDGMITMPSGNVLKICHPEIGGPDLPLLPGA